MGRVLQVGHPRDQAFAEIDGGIGGQFGRLSQLLPVPAGVVLRHAFPTLQKSIVEFLQPPEDDLRIAGDADPDGIMAHKILFIMSQKDFILVDNPGIARLAGAHVGGDFFTDEERIDEKFHHPGKHLVRAPIKRSEEAHDPASLPGGSGVIEGLAQKQAAAVGRVPGPLEIGGR